MGSETSPGGKAQNGQTTHRSHTHPPIEVELPTTSRCAWTRMRPYGELPPHTIDTKGIAGTWATCATCTPRASIWTVPRGTTHQVPSPRITKCHPYGYGHHRRSRLTARPVKTKCLAGASLHRKTVCLVIQHRRIRGAYPRDKKGGLGSRRDEGHGD